MKQITLYIFFCLALSELSGQNIEWSGGMNRNSFFDLQKKDDPTFTKYTPAYGYSFGFSISNIIFDSLPFRISLRIDNYKGSFNTSDGGLAGSSTTSATVEKTSLGLGFYPMNFIILKKIELSIGAEISYRIYDKTNGYKESWFMGKHSYMTLENDSVKVNNDVIVGLSARIRYEIKINKEWSIMPQYGFYITWSDEFKNTEAKIKSLRHNFEIGITRRIK